MSSETDLKDKKDLIFDGGFASQLVKDGHDIYGDPLWSARLLSTEPNAIKTVHKKFLAAGADAVISSSYQASIDGFQKYLVCSEKEAEDLMKLSGKLVRQACDEFWEEYKLRPKETSVKQGDRIRPLAVASLGPYGACLLNGAEYNGDYVETVSSVQLMEWHKRRLDLLAHENLDLYLFETFPALDEVKAVVPLMQQYRELKFAVSFTCKDDSSLSLCHGESFKEAVEYIDTIPEIVAVGINCSSPEYISDLLKSITGVTQKNILVMANSGEYWTAKAWLPNDKVKTIPDYVIEWNTLGANWIGGCCRTYCADISKIRNLLKLPRV